MFVKLTLEWLESRQCPAVLDVDAGALTFTGDGQNDTVTQYVSGGTLVVNDSTATISLTADAVAANWKGNGTHTVTGPRASVTSESFELGTGTNVLNLRACDVPVTIDCTGGVTAVNISANAPANTADLRGILGDVTVIGDGDDTLWVSDQGATSGNGDVEIDSTGIYGLAGPSDEYAILTHGTFATERVTGSSTPSVTEMFTINGTAATTRFRLDTNAGQATVNVLSLGVDATLYGGSGDDTFNLGVPGNIDPLVGTITLNSSGGDDTINVQADAGGTINGWTGDDTITIFPGVTWTGDVHTGTGSDVVNYGPPTWGTITGTVGV